MGALALTSKAAYRDAVRAAARRRHLRPVRRRRRARRRGHRRDRRGRPRADPGRGRRRRAARGLPRRGPRDRRRARRAAVARRGADRHGPHRRVVRPPGTGVAPRRRHRSPRASAAASRSAPASALGAAGDLLEPGNHGTTFGGNPVACAAALAVIAHDRGRGPARARRPSLGQKLRDGLAADPRVTEVRGEGLLIGLDLAADASAEVAAAALERRLHRQHPTPDADPARAAAGAHRRRRRRVPRRLAGASSTTADARSACMTRHFLRDDDLSPGRAGRGPRPRRRAQAGAVRRASRSPARAPSR